jgi:hypothetical protein
MSVEEKTGVPGDESFLSRWARVKQSGGAPVEATTPSSSTGAPLEPKMPEDARPEPTLPADAAPVPLPALDSLTPQSDYSPFMAPDVDPQLRNLAMKKLFTDPHYNVMDRMDIYIDDYSTHAPLTEDIIRQMSISKAMRLFDDEEQVEGAGKLVPADAAAREAPPPVAEAKVDGLAETSTQERAEVRADAEKVKGPA